MMNRLVRLVVIACFLFQIPGAVRASTGEQAARDLIARFVREYQSLGIPDFQMSYQANFESIPPLDRLRLQERFFQRMHRRLGRIDLDELSDAVRSQLEILRFETGFHLTRVRLEKRFRSGREPILLPRDGLHGLPDFRDWYKLYIRRWSSREIAPPALVEFGKAEVRRVTGEIRRLQRQLGFEGRDADFSRYLHEPGFTITDEAELKTGLERVRATILARLGEAFEDTRVSPVDLQPVANPTKDTPPGYFAKGVFHYSFFDNRFPRRSLEWLFLHEALPGHHFQTEVARKSRSSSALADLFWYPGFSEGWGAYSEDLGKELGCYADPTMELGKWEWDLVRSARIVVDAGIHYLGWSRRRAIAWWRKNVPDQAEIAVREVDRIIRWPAQVISYKVGERTILKLRKLAQEREGTAFDLRRFHSLILRQGSIPLDLLEKSVQRELGR